MCFCAGDRFASCSAATTASFRRLLSFAGLARRSVSLMLSNWLNRPGEAWRPQKTATRWIGNISEPATGVERQKQNKLTSTSTCSLSCSATLSQPMPESTLRSHSLVIGMHVKQMEFKGEHVFPSMSRLKQHNQHLIGAEWIKNVNTNRSEWLWELLQLLGNRRRIPQRAKSDTIVMQTTLSTSAH